MNEFDLYADIKARTNGEIYIGVVGPVRTGKSTFIKRFMELAVLPNIEDENDRKRAVDEMPQAASGKTIMTTEPKFIPKEAVEVSVGNGINFNVRLIDCVGYMAEGATGHIENERERLVKTPWFDYEIPFTQAAEIGTNKVVGEHSTVAVVITTDGSFGEIKRNGYSTAEEKTITQLKKIGKPFIVILNSNSPYSEETLRLAGELEEKYDVSVLPLNCEQFRKDDINRVLEQLVSAFPITGIGFYTPKWIEMLPATHYIKTALISSIKELLKDFRYMKDIRNENFVIENPYIKELKINKINMQNGNVAVDVLIDDAYYYKVISEITNTDIKDEYSLVAMIKELAEIKSEYDKVKEACDDVRCKGYGVVAPVKEEIELSEPEIIRQGNKYGVKIRATAPSIHMIQANIETEIAPIVGSEEQAQDLIRYMKEKSNDGEDGIWTTNIFGKTMKQLIDEGIMTKINRMSDDSRQKLQDTVQKIINESNGGVICFII